MLDFEYTTPFWYDVPRDVESDDCWCHPMVVEYGDYMEIEHYAGVC